MVGGPWPSTTAAHSSGLRRYKGGELGRGIRDWIRRLVFFTPWVSIPLMALGVVLVLIYPLTLLSSEGWIGYPIAVVLAAGLGAWLRPRYRLAILDSSPLGVFYWLQKRY